MNIKTIKEAVRMHRGGLQGATDTQIMIIWESLEEETQKQYLENYNKTQRERKANHAPGDKSG